MSNSTTAQEQLDILETNALTLHSNDVNVSEAAIAVLKTSIHDFGPPLSSGR